MAWTKLGSTSVSGAAANTSWKELGRTTLSGTNDSIDVSSFTAKDNLMILCNVINSGGDFRTFWRFNSDTGSNYSQRYNTNNGSDSTNTSLNGTMDWNTAESVQSFEVLNIANITTQEKLGIKHKIGSGTAGAGNGVNYVECVGKWANTSAQITSVSVGDGVDPKSGTGGIGSEVVVLGYDNDEADSGTNFWQELATIDVTTAGDNFTTGTFTAKKYLMVETNVITSGGAVSQRMTFNDDTGSNYAQRKSFDGASDTTSTNSVNIDGINDDLVTNSIGIANIFIVNKSDKEKLGIAHTNSGEASGAGNTPTRDEEVFKWNNTSAQITKIDFDNNKAGNWAVGSFVKVYGAD